ncbi:hypothetical protein CMV_019622 [Castanea mollissima]|uniref:Uncharacterized protein n=1 Tax=Castanea mollissima TaxID=60419 RepID=A0A8J4VB99_9ROSI|nr:hypothetical protein CMV_019622 [Castanea mollissima]
MIVEYKVLQEVFNKFYFDKNFLPQPPRCLPVIEQYTTRGKFERLIECCVYTLIQIGCLMSDATFIPKHEQELAADNSKYGFEAGFVPPSLINFENSLPRDLIIVKMPQDNDFRCYIGIQSNLPSCGRSKCNGAIGYIGSIGNDKFGEEMTKNLSSAGFNVHYYN